MIVSIRRTVGLGLVAALLIAITASPSHAQTLRWKLKKGQKLGYTMTQTSNISTAAMGMAVEMKVIYIMNTAWTVKDVKSDGNAVVVQKLSRIRMAMEGAPFGKIEYDSDKKEGGGGVLGDAFKKAFEPLVNAEFTTTITPRGQITNLEMSEALKAALKKAGGQGAPGGGGISADTFKQMTMGASFPDGTLTKGKTWTQKTEINMPFGKLVTNTNMKYQGTASIGGRTVAKIEMTPKFTLTPKAGAPAAITMTDKGGSGLSYFDIEKGVMTASDLTQKMEMQVTVGTVMQKLTMKAVTQIRLDSEK